MRPLSLAAALAALLSAPSYGETFREAFPAQYESLYDQYKDRTGALELVHGTMAISSGIAEVVLPDGYYALGPADARYVAETLWGNPPDDTVLGLVFKAGTSPIDEKAWGLVLKYDPMGHVSDDDAAGIDYDQMMADMKADSVAENEERVKQGFPRIEILGWAAPPRYDPVERKLHWAKRLQFEGSDGETLNYNIRVLGRKGVIVANFVAGMDMLAEIEAAAPEVLPMIRFTPGNRYADFDPAVDNVAEGGIGGLISGDFAANAGIMLLLLALLKKGGFLVALPLLWVGRLFKGRGKGDGSSSV